jgi:selenocysteine lyase/cysteine desulfurase
MITAKIGNRAFQMDGELERYFRSFRKGIIGVNQWFRTPYGMKPLIYADWTGSGRLYRPIEEKIINEFGPFMANTHTESNVTSSVMTLAYEQAKDIIKKHVHANEFDVILLDGSGMTSVVNKLQRILGLRVPEKWKHRIRLEEPERPVIFVSHMEHHSNHTSWEETIGDVIVVPPDLKGLLDMEALEALLVKYQHRLTKIGSFSAGSNVTGIQLPYHQLAKKMHQHGGICFVDFAASAPYVDINMHPDDPMEKLDGIFFSPHKFLGGPGSSGVAIFDSRLYENMVPDHPGGGTVLWTNPWGGHHYFSDIEVREDGGTPGILQGIKAALAIQLKEEMGVSNILAREKELLAILIPALKEIPQCRVLEDHVDDRLGIVSFTLENIHYNLVVNLLNDRFGYQVRGGCSCAGTYGHYLFNIDSVTSQKITDHIDQGDQSIKPGWVRFSLHPTMTNEEVYRFIHSIKSILANKDEWEKDYFYDPKSNDFFHAGYRRADMERMFRL